MRFTYTAVFRPKGVAGSGPVDRVLCEFPAEKARALLTTDVDSHVVDCDRERAVAQLLLSGLFSPARLPEGTPDERVATVADERRRERAAKYPNAAFIVCTIDGETSLTEPAHTKETETFAACFETVDKVALRQTLRPVLERMMCLVVLGMPQIVGLDQVTDCFVFRRDDGKVLFSYSPIVSGSAHVSRSASEDSFTVMAALQSACEETTGLERILRLLMDSLLEHSDGLRAFLTAWAGLEMFVNKCFPAYEKALFERLGRDVPAARGAYFERVQAVMKDKYRLSEKLGLLASDLAPDDSTADAETFADAKKKRDKLSHGDEVAEESLPTEQVRGLLRKYLQLHLERQSRDTNAV